MVPKASKMSPVVQISPATTRLRPTAETEANLDVAEPTSPKVRTVAEGADNTTLRPKPVNVPSKVMPSFVAVAPL